MRPLNLFKKPEAPKACTTCGCSDFTIESADEVLFDSYTKGVTFRMEGNRLLLTYNGLLAKSGAKEVIAVVGYGDPQNWQDTRYYPMNPVQPQTFELLFPVSDNENLNIAFTDAADNWDNNAGNNYRFYTH